MDPRRLLFLLTLIIFLLPNAYATCEEGLIDINSASATELEELYGIGPVKAEAIIEARPFETIDDLIDVNGIGEATLQGIKSQGLACVDDSDEDREEVEIEEVAEREIIESQAESKNVNLQPINLDSEVIKTGNSQEVKSIIALYGLVAFGVLLCLLFLLKRKKKNGLV